MIRLLHAADLHLDSPFAALKPEQAARRREEQRDVLRRLVSSCNDLRCDLLLLAGDLFDSGQIYRQTAEALCAALRECKAQVFIAPGNHDFYSPSSVYASLRWPENVHIFSSATIEAVRLTQPEVTVYGAAFTQAHAAPLLRDFRAEPSDACSVMVIHGELSNSGGVYNPITVEQVNASGLDYLALGHTHTDSLRRVGRTTVGIPGCAMGRGFDETGEKGAFYVELDPDGCRVRPVCLGARQYQVLQVRVTGDPLTSVLRELPENSQRDIYRIELVGSCQKPDLKRLREALAPRFYELELIDHTLPPLELWSAMEEESLKGAFLRNMKEIYDRTDGEERQTAALAARLGLAIMEQREVTDL